MADAAEPAGGITSQLVPTLGVGGRGLESVLQQTCGDGEGRAAGRFGKAAQGARFTKPYRTIKNLPGQVSDAVHLAGSTR